MTTVTALLVPKLRRMTAEPTTVTYGNEALEEYILLYPVPDSEGRNPLGSSWVETYDLHAAAGDIWDEKAAAVADKISFSADGGNYHSDQHYQHCEKMARYHRSLRRAQNRGNADQQRSSSDESYIVN